ncbi:MAG: hypothetical protein ACI4JQ_00885 [Ruminococcus sp.]
MKKIDDFIGMGAIMLIKKFFRKFTAAVVSTAIIGSTVGISASATTLSYTIDNDPLSSSGNSAGGYGFSYMTASGCYNGDAERASNVSGYYYYWNHPRVYLNAIKSVRISVSAYLNNSTFTDRYAEYYVLTDGAMDKIATIDQNAAPGGWGPSYTATISQCTVLGQVMVKASGSVGNYTGADAVLVTYVYS